jgi:hypothetical protein
MANSLPFNKQKTIQSYRREIIWNFKALSAEGSKGGPIKIAKCNKVARRELKFAISRFYFVALHLAPEGTFVDSQLLSGPLPAPLVLVKRFDDDLSFCPLEEGDGGRSGSFRRFPSHRL